MFQQGKFDIIDEEKQVLKEQLYAQNMLIGQLDENDGDDIYAKRYAILHSAIAEITVQMTTLRLEGGEFPVTKKTTEQILEISKDGRIVLCDIKNTTEPQIPENMSHYPYFRVGLQPVVESEITSDTEETSEKPLKMYSLVYASQENVYYLEDVNCIKVTEKEGGTQTLNICWKNKKKDLILKSEHLEEISEVLGAKLKHFNRNKLTQIEYLRSLWDMRNTSYDKENEEHERLLLEFWNITFPHSALESRITSQWGKIGFQGKDPATDFRGGGVLSLHCLLYVSRNHNSEVQNILEKGREYPFAVAGINIAHELLLNFLKLDSVTMQHLPSSAKWNSDLLTFFCYADIPDGFYYVFALFLFLMDALWESMDATYMQFPDVMRRTKKQFSSILARRPLSMPELDAYVKQEVLMLQS